MSTIELQAEMPDRGGRNQVGIHLDIDALRVVEVIHGRIKECRSVAYPAGLQPGAPGFAAFLKETVTALPGLRHAPMWVVGPLPSLQVRFITLPKVRPSQLSNLVYWTFRKEIPFDAAQVVFDYDQEGESSAPGQARKLDVTACTVSHADVKQLTALFEEAGLHLEGLIIPSFSMRNVLRSLPRGANEVVLGLYVGEDASSIMFMKGRHVIAHRVFKTGLNVMLDVLRDRHPDWSPAKTLQTIAQALPDPSGAAAESSEEATRLSETVHAAFGRLIQQVERSISAYLVGRSDEEIRNIYVAGSLARLPALVAELGSKLGLNSQPLNGFEGRLVQPKPASSMAPAEAGMLAIALGAALADPVHSPNLLHTYVRREHEERMKHTRRLLSVLGIAALVGLVAVNVALIRYNAGLRRQLADQQARIEKYAPYPDRAMIEALTGKAALNSAQLKSMAVGCLPLAALNVLALHTPPDVRLQSIEMAMHEAPPPPTGRRSSAVPVPVAPGMRMRVTGLVSGDPSLQESKLAAYILRLEDTELYRRAVVTRSEQGREGPDPILLFGLTLELEDLSETPLAVAAPAAAAPGLSLGGAP